MKVWGAVSDRSQFFIDELFFFFLRVSDSLNKKKEKRTKWEDRKVAFVSYLSSL